MLPDLVSNTGPLTYESGAISIALRGPARAMASTFSSAFENKSSLISSCEIDVQLCIQHYIKLLDRH